ncbi:E3 SUMO-protein ligase RanBP2 [Desmophyllum pertusum]|uniref:E3 SUMO-protein ligase RanBP2 n=1 Tax=Desmophyllum pertusum TaxID=174260 RepID=A0A9X0A3X9_9CNID|nr:E3 SUMO-protein ligase RanBP2 [Desmophyllum pertusum]
MASPGTPSPRKPKSPLSPSSPLSPESPGYAEDDGPHFEPLIPLPEKVESRTGEEGQEVLFCDRCKLYRYDSDTSQWKDRGVGDIKILHHPSSERYRVLMRREHVFKLCANHMVSADMVLKPFPNSDRAWLWTTLADFSEEVSSAETLAARFRTNEIAGQFKDTFDKAVQSRACKADIVESGAKPEGKHPAVVFDKGVTDDQKERAKRLELPSHFFGYESSSSEASSDHSETCASKQDQPTSNDGPEEISTPSKRQSIDEKKQGKSPGFTGVGSQLFATRNTDDDDGTTEVDHDGPRFEPVIPLPDKIDVKTGRR